VDRNVVIATVLIALIMVVWLTWLTPPIPPPGGVTGTDTLAVVVPEPSEEDAAPRSPAVPVLTDSTLALAQVGEERLITVENDLYRAQFSTRGASLVSFQLKDYTRADSSSLVQMVDTTRGGTLSLAFTTPANHNVDTRAFFFEPSLSGEALQVGEAPVELAFTARLGDGMIRQTYTFSPGTYEVGLRIDQESVSSFSTGEGYDLVWSGGVPFTEGNIENEATRSGTFARSGGEVEGVELSSDAYQERALRGDVSWVAVKNKYFTAVMIPDGETRGAELIGERFGTAEAGTLQESYTSSLMMPASTGTDVFRLYIGPMEYYRIAAYDLDLYDMVDFGWDWFEWITRPLARFVFIPTFTFLHTFIPNYGLLIIVLSLLIKLVLYPLTKSSFTSMARMRELQPKMEAIKEKYADNPQKQQEATMKMYKETGVNPLGGCLPMLLQYPIIIALWQFLPQAIEIRQQGFLWATDLSAPDIILNLPFEIPLYGNYVAGFTLLMGLSMVIQMRLQSGPASNAQTKIFTYVFPIMIPMIFNKLASGLNLYYLCYNVLTAAQQKLINNTLHKQGIGSNGKGGKQDVKVSGKPIKGKGGGGSKKKTRS